MAGLYKQSFKKTVLDTPDLSIYNCGLQRCDAGYTWGPGVRDHYLIHLVTAGKGSYFVNGAEFTPEAGDLFFAKPSQLIQYTADTEQPWEYYWVGYNGSNAARLAQNLPFTGEHPVYRCQNATRARDLLHKIFLSRGPHVQDETRMVGYLYLFMALLMQETQDAGRQPPTTGAAYVVGAVKYIQFNYSRDIGVDDIAGAVGVSRSHLYRVFMANLGQSPIDYLTDFRIGEACKLLETTALSVAEIAYSVGFFDQFYFSRVFKKSKGMPPSRYSKKTE